jgi:hypothetical protein
MNTIIIEGVDQASAAALWAQSEFGHGWNVQIDGGPFSGVYAFSFKKPEDATLFALKWR